MVPRETPPSHGTAPPRPPPRALLGAFRKTAAPGIAATAAVVPLALHGASTPTLAVVAATVAGLGRTVIAVSRLVWRAFGQPLEVFLADVAEELFERARRKYRIPRRTGAATALTPADAPPPGGDVIPPSVTAVERRV